MKFNISLEWSYELGLPARVVLCFGDLLEEYFKGKYYGFGIESIGILLICRSAILKQRTRLFKERKYLEFDLILPYELIKAAAIPEKRQIIKQEILTHCELVLNKYEVDDFDKKLFLRDLKDYTMSMRWD